MLSITCPISKEVDLSSPRHLSSSRSGRLVPLRQRPDTCLRFCSYERGTFAPSARKLTYPHRGGIDVSSADVLVSISKEVDLSLPWGGSASNVDVLVSISKEVDLSLP